MGVLYSPKIVQDGLVLMLDAANPKSYPGTGTTWNDLSGNGNNGTLTNGPTFDSGDNGSIALDGTNDYVSLSNPTSFAGPYTILLWVIPDTALVAGGSGANKPNGFNRKTPIVGPGPVWNPGIWVTSDYIRSHADTQYVDSSIEWTTGWEMIGMTYDGTNVKNIFGGEVLANAYTSGYSPSNPTTLYLGAEQSGGNSQNWNGRIGPLYVYNKVLTSQEILQNYNATKSRYNL